VRVVQVAPVVPVYPERQVFLVEILLLGLWLLLRVVVAGGIRPTTVLMVVQAVALGQAVPQVVLEVLEILRL
jgi:hypothetical protein